MKSTPHHLPVKLIVQDYSEMKMTEVKDECDDISTETLDKLDEHGFKSIPTSALSSMLLFTNNEETR